MYNSVAGSSEMEDRIDTIQETWNWTKSTGEHTSNPIIILKHFGLVGNVCTEDVIKNATNECRDVNEPIN